MYYKLDDIITISIKSMNASKKFDIVDIFSQEFENYEIIKSKACFQKDDSLLARAFFFNTFYYHKWYESIFAHLDKFMFITGQLRTAAKIRPDQLSQARKLYITYLLVIFIKARYIYMAVMCQGSYG